ncbi:hypothetical protein N9L68_00185 [bacterium]|nr:hypothetical protein [bacterium]
MRITGEVPQEVEAVDSDGAERFPLMGFEIIQRSLITDAPPRMYQDRNGAFEWEHTMLSGGLFVSDASHQLLDLGNVLGLRVNSNGRWCQRSEDDWPTGVSPTLEPSDTSLQSW